MLDCVRRPAQELQAAQGVEVEVFSRADADVAADAAAWNPLHVQLFPAAGPASFGFARGLDAALRTAETDLAPSASGLICPWWPRTGASAPVAPIS